MSTIVIYAAGTLGDHLPFLALGETLRTRGYHVRLAVNPAMCSLVQRAGLEAVALPEPTLGATEARRQAQQWDHWQDAHLPLLNVDGAIRRLHHLLTLCRQADMLLATSLRPWGWLVQQVLGLPGLTVSVMPAQFWQPPTPAHPRAGAKPQNETLAAWHQHYRRGMQQITAALGVVLPETLERRLLIMPEVLLASSPQFSQPMPVEGPSGPVAPLPTGFWFYDGPKWAISEPPIALRRFVERHPRPLVLSFSSLPVANRREVLAVHVETAALLHRPLVVQTGWAGFCRQDLPRGTRAHDVLFVDFLPHDWLFARAACAIQHGGIGSIARALRHGCPLLLEPYGNDQFFNAMRVVALGVGAAMQPSTLKAAGLARVLQEQVLAPSTRHRCATLGATIRAEAGLEVAYERIDSRLVSAGGRMPRSRCGAKPPKV